MGMGYFTIPFPRNKGSNGASQNLYSRLSHLQLLTTSENSTNYRSKIFFKTSSALNTENRPFSCHDSLQNITIYISFTIYIGLSIRNNLEMI